MRCIRRRQRGDKASGVGEILQRLISMILMQNITMQSQRRLQILNFPATAAEQIPRAAAAIFKAVDGYGLSRVDFFVKADGEVVFNEINTMPGFTAISMYPMLWEARGIGKEQLVDMLLEHGLKTLFLKRAAP